MKIFNWVHRKFHNKDESSENVKMIKAEHGTGALLEQVALDEVIDDWSQGILAIGTFGYDPSPNCFNQQVQFHWFENEEELEMLEKEGAKEDGAQVENETFDVEGGEHNQLMPNASQNGGSNDENICFHDQNGTKSKISILAVDDLENVQCAKKEYYEKKERITLADLFLTDSDEYIPHTEFDDKEQADVLNKPKSKADGKVSSKLKLPFAKKFIPPIKQEYSNSSPHSRGIKKIHKMMTRMLKKKVHPELESKKQIKKENKIKYGGNGVTEMASLLQTQDAIFCP
ncbi:Protein TILLER ANGLE CONTROL 1 [Heracleum sosnowskyi]|uniref:Protein TILLER ANGLE CONTROL 1 n=1 Tax=Heracleum sosnowskyi TaxID=360622 RepID=A0AAD8HMB7_9APIA|nr:Protein TILLER ANGLE CONTROL 1 [Heracleum sosnowskyi]